MTLPRRRPARFKWDCRGRQREIRWAGKLPDLGRPNLGKNRGFQVAVVAHHLPEDSQEIRKRSLINHKVGSL